MLTSTMRFFLDLFTSLEVKAAHAWEREHLAQAARVDSCPRKIVQRVRQWEPRGSRRVPGWELREWQPRVPTPVERAKEMANQHYVPKV